MAKEIKFDFVFKHPESKEILISASYTLDEILDKNLEEIQESCCTCNCQPIGETNVVECNCEDYYNDFELIGKRQYVGFYDKNGDEIFNLDILKCGKAICMVEFVEGAFIFTQKKDWLDEWNWADDSQRFEIIGNVYKNPEFLLF